MRGQRHTPAALYPRERPGTHLQGAGWAPGPVWTGAENLASTGIRSPGRLACSQSLYGLSYRAHEFLRIHLKFHREPRLFITFHCQMP